MIMNRTHYTCRLDFRSWVREASGASTVEYAVMLALVVASMACGALLLGNSSDQAMAAINGKFGFSVAGRAEAARPVVSPLGSATQGSEQSLSRSRIVALFVSVALAFAAGALVVVRRKKKVPAPASLEASDPTPSFTADSYAGKRQEILRAFSGDLQSFLTNHILARQLMSTQLLTVDQSTTVAEMQAVLKRRKQRHLLIVDGEGRLAGVISDRDLHVKADIQAHSIMTRKVRVCSSDTPLRQVVSQLLDQRISSLPVVDGERLAGIITLTDIAMGLQCAMQVIDRIAHELTSDSITAAALITATGSQAMRDDSLGNGHDE
jgi:CBS domain-containing protein/Flp pilus assembly pilin Flp